MLSFLLQSVLLIHRLSAGVEFLGTVLSFQPENTNSDGSVTVVLHSKLSSQRCTSMSWECLTGSCGNQTAATVNTVIEDEGERWCQTESVSRRLVNSDASFQLLLMGGNWTSSIQNGSLPLRAVTLVDLRRRSDTTRANSSPQTTVLPTVRVPSNCRRDFSLLMLDPDQDEVRCRFKNQPPSVLSLSPSCTLSFEPSSSDEGVFAVQLLMEDFPRQNITLKQSNGSTEEKTTRDAISRVPVQFVLKVDPVVPSCSEGLYLPRFLPPTPANRAQLIASVGQLLEINVTAAVNKSKISKLLLSGPHNVTVVTDRVQNTSGQFVLRWTPSESDAAATHPICFVVKAAHNGSSFHSDLRCVIVRVESLTTLPAAKANTAFSPSPTNTSTSPPIAASTSLPPTTELTTTPGANAKTAFIPPPPTALIGSPLTNTTTPPANAKIPPTSSPPTTKLPTTPAANATSAFSPPPTNPSTSPPKAASTSPPPTTSIHPSPTASTSQPPPTKPVTPPTANATTAFIAPPTTAPIGPPPPTNTTRPAANVTVPPTSPPPTASTGPSPPTNPTTFAGNATIPFTIPPMATSTGPPPTTKPITTLAPNATTAFSPPPTNPSTSPPPPTKTASPEANETVPPTSPPPTTPTYPPLTASTRPPPPPTNPTTPATTIPPTSPRPTAPIGLTSPTTNTPPAYVVGLRVKVSSSLHPSQTDTDAVLDQIKALLASEGLQLDVAQISISLRPHAGTTAPPAAGT